MAADAALKANQRDLASASAKTRDEETDDEDTFQVLLDCDTLPSGDDLRRSGMTERSDEETRSLLDWRRLDNYILPLIASRLRGSTCDLSSARLVCRLWASEVHQALTKLEVKGQGPVGWSERYSGLKELHWTNPSPEDTRWPSWPSLRTLTMPGSTDRDLQMLLRDLPGLTCLSLNLDHRDSHMTWSTITDEGLKDLKHTPLLSSLRLTGCREITDEGLKELKHLTSLTSLDLTRCLQITTAGLKETLSGMSNLTSLNLRGLSVADGLFKGLEHLSALSSLNLHGCPGITGADFKGLGHLPAFDSLDLTCSFNLTHEGLKQLRRITTLTSLNLSRNASVTDADLRELSHITTLTYLNLSHCNQITDAGLRRLRPLSSLTFLSLRGCSKVEGEGLKELRYPRSVHQIRSKLRVYY